MWDSINKILANIDDFVWGVPLMAIIITGGILLTFRLGFLQLRRLGLALKWMVKMICHVRLKELKNIRQIVIYSLEQSKICCSHKKAECSLKNRGKI